MRCALSHACPSRLACGLASCACACPWSSACATGASCRRLLDAVDAEIPAVFATLPPLPAAPAMPPAGDVPAVLAALDTYRKTSPEMVVFGRMIGAALPTPLAPHE